MKQNNHKTENCISRGLAELASEPLSAPGPEEKTVLLKNKGKTRKHSFLRPSALNYGQNQRKHINFDSSTLKTAQIQRKHINFDPSTLKISKFQRQFMFFGEFHG